jgi:hypothetical protein
MTSQHRPGSLSGKSLSCAPRQPRKRAAEPRGHLALAEENNGLTPWCGPSAVALATGLAYHDASDLLRGTAPGWYPEEGPIVTAYWRDLLTALRDAGVEHEVLDPAEDAPRQSLLRFARGNLAPGWYLVRVTDHFLLLRSHGFGLATIYDNRHSGALLSARTHGRRKVTHVARLLGGPLLDAA